MAKALEVQQVPNGDTAVHQQPYTTVGEDRLQVLRGAHRRDGRAQGLQSGHGGKVGITLFAPKDAAFHAKGVPDVDAMPWANLAALLRYHALPG
uniref:Uncharacterized protein n=1 Tax=Aegilops tauschii TaxID=37682 RepID=R7WDE8_AEGTA